ncbi:hypothetical protein BC835DRAFT_1366071 [Cytidiella melzeri]|nr:hypothetical protein BC835DRAFT_1366071 [Cytidiella melzeri]
MYRLATKLQLPHLAKLSEDAIIADLRLANIVRELFSDFTWRYPEILKREVAFFREHSQKRRVRKDLREAFGDVVLGKYPHGQTVLVALFDNLIPAL